MRFRTKSREEKLKPLREWHRKFAWLPTWIRGKKWVWLEFYERKLDHYQSWQPFGSDEYRWKRRII